MPARSMFDGWMIPTPYIDQVEFLLDDLSRDALAVQGNGGGEAADAAADDQNASNARHGFVCWSNDRIPAMLCEVDGLSSEHLPRQCEAS